MPRPAHTLGLARALGHLLTGRRYRPAARERVRAHGDGLPAPVDRPLKVVSWNLQFCAGRRQAFFYDGGRGVRSTRCEVEATLEGVVGVLRALRPDVLLLQEVDRSSDRTLRIDQHQELAHSLGFGCWASTPYFKSPYVPHPPHQHLGRVEMHLSVFSRYQLGDGFRVRLPALDEAWVRKQFNLKRAILEVPLKLADGRQLMLLNTHLSAFSKGDGTLSKQVQLVESRLKRLDRDGIPWLLAGDFNSLPPGDDPHRLGYAGLLYPEKVSPVAPLFERYRSVIPAERYADEPEATRTYLPYGSNQPDRVLDYGFVSAGVGAVDARVLSQHHRWSDHLPLQIELKP